MSSDDGILRLIEVYVPEADTCAFHLDKSGARILDFVNDASEAECDRYLNAALDVKVIPYGGLLYVCHAFESGSWNDAPGTGRIVYATSENRKIASLTPISRILTGGKIFFWSNSSKRS